MHNAVWSGYVPSFPAAFIDMLADPGRWRERGITHWHFVLQELPLTVDGRPNGARFHTEQIRTLVDLARAGVAHDPRDALTWLATQWTGVLTDPSRCPEPVEAARRRGWATEEGWRHQLRSSWETLAGGSLITPTGGGMEIRPGWSFEVHCYPMTSARCRRHGPA